MDETRIRTAVIGAGKMGSIRLQTMVRERLDRPPVVPQWEVIFLRQACNGRIDAAVALIVIGLGSQHRKHSLLNGKFNDGTHLALENILVPDIVGAQGDQVLHPPQKDKTACRLLFEELLP